MLRYFKKYVWAAYALSVLIPAASLAAFSLVMGGNVVKTLPGLFSSLMLFFACLYVMPRLMGQLADRKAEQLVSLYNDGCDPDAFRARPRHRGAVHGGGLVVPVVLRAGACRWRPGRGGGAHRRGPARERRAGAG